MYHSLFILDWMVFKRKIIHKSYEIVLIILDLVYLDVLYSVNLHDGHNCWLCPILVLFYVEFIIVI